ncbi:MAG TPA: YdcF family protein [Cytophagaceae bacterium]|jgi:uncharacterized SAM-binding protein YcdF (DUF218 family)|nr:YdcF family protein [Cytophagaceae bacterium]
MSLRIYLTIIVSSILFFNSCVFLGPSQKELYIRAQKKKPYDVIIVPGVPYDSASQNWSNAMKGRVYWSLYLYQKGMASNIIYSGSAVYTPYIEAKIMAMIGEKLGIPSEHIFVETKAEHSTENIYYSYYAAKKLGFNSIAVATDPFQAKMLKGYPRKIKINIDFIPFIMDSLKTIDRADKIEIDADKAKVKQFVSIVDRENRFKRIWGTMGKNIKRVEEDERFKKKKL